MCRVPGSVAHRSLHHRGYFGFGRHRVGARELPDDVGAGRVGKPHRVAGTVAGGSRWQSAPPNASPAPRPLTTSTLIGGTTFPAPGGDEHAVGAELQPARRSRRRAGTGPRIANTPNFYLARLLPGGGTSGRKLHLVFYDIGDISAGTTSARRVAPARCDGSAATCTWSRATTRGAGGCPPARWPVAPSGITTNTYPTGFNGAWYSRHRRSGQLQLRVASATGCWFKIQMSYTTARPRRPTTPPRGTRRSAGDPVR